MIVLDSDGKPFDDILEAAIDIGAHDVQETDSNEIKVPTPSSFVTPRCL
jgi:transcriptional/translational regulatory protein YebC/TACO1